MPTISKKTNSIIFYYVFICVLIGCVETSMNQKIFEQQREKEAPAKEIVVTPITPSAQVQPEQLEWEGCPTKEGVLASIASFKKLTSDTQKLVVALNNEGDAEEQKFRFRLEQWENEAKTWKIKNCSILQHCDLLWGATGVSAIPEIPLALENLQNAGAWLRWSIDSAQTGKDAAARTYIASARLATERARDLINGRIKPRRKTAIVKLPRHLQKRHQYFQNRQRASSEKGCSPKE